MTRYESCVGARIILRLKRPNPELGRLFFPAYFRSYDIIILYNLYCGFFWRVPEPFRSILEYARVVQASR